MLVSSKKKQVKILLVAVNNETEPYPVAPIGVAYVGQALLDHGNDVRILDLCFSNNEEAVIKNAIGAFSPDIVGISIRNIDNLTYGKSVFYLPRIREIVNVIKKHTSATIVAGGSGFSIFPEEALRYLDINYGVIGEGEHAFPALVDAVVDGGSIESIPNVCSISRGVFTANLTQSNFFKNLPNRDFLANSAYLELGGMGNIQSKRGCPFNCTYCTYPNIEGKRLRLREPESIADELEVMLTKYGITHAFFVDDIFNYPDEHALKICEGIIRKGVNISWTCFATPKGMTRELALMMKKAGCKGVEFGSDAATETTLNGLGKNFSQDEIALATECCNNVDLPNAHYIIIGGPGETAFTIKESLEFFDRICPSAVIALLGLRIYPNTQLCKQAIADGVIPDGKNLLEPVFYISPEIDDSPYIDKILQAAECQKNWVVPGFSVGCDFGKLNQLRRMGMRGPLWDMLPNKSARRR